MATVYMIRDKKSGLFSKGMIRSGINKDGKEVGYVKFEKRGKIWNSEKTIKDHLLKMMLLGGIPSTWEVVELVYQPTKSIEEWVDPKMLMKVLKKS